MRLALTFVAVAWIAFAAACSHLPFAGVPPAFAGTPSLSVGEWTGETSQGMPIAFTVSSTETVTSITIGYDFNDCSGSKTFADLNVRTAPQVTCIPGPCSGTVNSYRAFSYLDGSFGSSPVTQINGLFLPGNEAKGQVIFSDYPSCGTATPVEWSARRR